MLPAPSYDLWEERRGILTFTCAAVYGGLVAAAEFAHAFGDAEHAERYAHAAREIRDGMDQHLWRPELGRFARMINVRDDGAISVDTMIDASLYGAFAFGAYPPDDPRIEATMKAVRERLWCKTEVGGVARYEDDYYHAVSQDIDNVPGNPWFICTMWLALHVVAKAKTRRGAARGGRDPRVGRLAQAAVGRAGRAGQSVHQRADVGVAADLEPRHGRRRGAVVPGETRGRRALPDLRRAQAAQDRRLRAQPNPIFRIATEGGHGRDPANPLREGLRGERVPPPTTMVIFGASGDLTKRKLVPALYSLARDRLLPSMLQRRRRGAPRHARRHLPPAMREACDKFARRRPVEEGCGSRSPTGMHLRRAARSRIRRPTSA